MPWDTSSRRQHLPADWPNRRAKTKQRAQGRCEASPHHPKCDGTGTECDHIIPGDNHSLTNLQWLSKPCHQTKTQNEAHAAQPKRRRQPEPHPGIITTPGD